MSIRTAAPLILCLTLAAAAAAQARAVAEPPAMKPGLWETTQVTETPATTSKRTVTSQTCYSADDVRAVSRILPLQHEAPLKCQNRDIKVDAFGGVEWRIVCTGPTGSTNGTGRMKLAGDTFTAQANLASTAAGKAGKPVKAEQTTSGKWVSDCK